ncbi:MAG TPA: EutN/CcmL family microcompartment protein [Gemmataceae bacterium]|jgi:ethanolamine utilization protein EutN|nr:EutN/CcmL family microcompartment protein [Gemmataceae bacterium]
MRIAEVIGTVTLSRAHPTMARARFIIGVPFSLKALQHDGGPDGEDVVIFDSLGAGNGHRVGFSEGAEAAAPFHPERKPLDAYCACIIDRITVSDR